MIPIWVLVSNIYTLWMLEILRVETVLSTLCPLYPNFLSWFKTFWPKTGHFWGFAKSKMWTLDNFWVALTFGLLQSSKMESWAGQSYYWNQILLNFFRILSTWTFTRPPTYLTWTIMDICPTTHPPHLVHVVFEWPLNYPIFKYFGWTRKKLLNWIGK